MVLGYFGSYPYKAGIFFFLAFFLIGVYGFCISNCFSAAMALRVHVGVVLARSMIICFRGISSLSVTRYMGYRIANSVKLGIFCESFDESVMGRQAHPL